MTPLHFFIGEGDYFLFAHLLPLLWLIHHLPFSNHAAAAKKVKVALFHFLLSFKNINLITLTNVVWIGKISLLLKFFLLTHTPYTFTSRPTEPSISPHRKKRSAEHTQFTVGSFALKCISALSTLPFLCCPTSPQPTLLLLVFQWEVRVLKRKKTTTTKKHY